MGIAMELRRAPFGNVDIDHWLWVHASTPAFITMRDAARTLYEDPGMYEPLTTAFNEGRLPEVLSEAIEAAEAEAL